MAQYRTQRLSSVGMQRFYIPENQTITIEGKIKGGRTKDSYLFGTITTVADRHPAVLRLYNSQTGETFLEKREEKGISANTFSEQVQIPAGHYAIELTADDGVTDDVSGDVEVSYYIPTEEAQAGNGEKPAGNGEIPAGTPWPGAQTNILDTLKQNKEIAIGAVAVIVALSIITN